MVYVKINIENILENVDINWENVKLDRKQFEENEQEMLKELAQMNQKMMRKFGVDIGNLLVHTADMFVLQGYPMTSEYYRGLAYAIWGKENELDYVKGIGNDLTQV
jgi:hypothetical protein